MPKPNSVGVGQLNSSSLHKQTRRNPLGDVRSPVENHDMVSSLPYSSKSQTHSRVSESSVQVKPGPINRMVTASAGVQQICQKWFTPHGDLFATRLNHSSTISSPRPTCLGHRCSKHKLVGSHCLCLPSHGSPSQGDPKNQAMQLPDHCNLDLHLRAGEIIPWSATLIKI